MIWWERLPKSPLGDFWGEESPLNPPWGTLRMQHKIIFLVFFGTVGILFSAVTRVDRVPTLSINSQHPNNSDRIGISFAERCFCPPGATLLSEFQHLRAYYYFTGYTKSPPWGNNVRRKPIRGLFSIHYDQTLHATSLPPHNCTNNVF